MEFRFCCYLVKNSIETISLQFSKKTLLVRLLAYYLPHQPRPIGVTVLTILQIISGMINILIATLILAVYFLALAIFGLFFSAAFGFFLIPLALLLFVFGIFSFILAYGLWTGRGWAWTASIILAVIGLAVGLLGLVFGGLANIATVILYALILVYLNTNGVRWWFGRPLRFPAPGPFRAPQSGVWYPPPVTPSSQIQFPNPAYQQGPIQQQPFPQPYYPRSPSSMVQPTLLWSPRGCPRCGDRVGSGAGFCIRCGSRLM